MDGCYTFREELATTHPLQGHALWEPDPGGLYDAVAVGDVGFIREGCFYTLFNVCVPHLIQTLMVLNTLPDYDPRSYLIFAWVGTTKDSFARRTSQRCLVTSPPLL